MRCPLFVELCAGTAALSLRLHAGRHARPPVSRMGAKTGYAHAILRVLGLRQGQGEGDGTRYLWCEPDAGVRLLLHAYTDRDLAQAAAAIIRSWKDEDPRALWERLRAEGPAVCPDVGMDAREVARLLTVMRWAYANVPIGHNGKHFTIPANGPNSPLTFGANNFGSTETTANGLDVVPELPALITDDARTVDPREVARVSRIISANRLVNPDPMTWQNTGQGGYIHGGPNFCTPIEDLVLAWDRCPEVPAVLCCDARAAQPETLPEGAVAYMDPPYLGTTGYAHDLGRPEVVELARRWADAGAVVCISEAEPIPELMADGWYSVDITETRRGQKRTFSKQQREWLTMSEAPKWRPSVALNLFSRGEG
jgi:hypothetical protein